jgi:hypothetical protein
MIRSACVPKPRLVALELGEPVNVPLNRLGGPASMEVYIDCRRC